MNRKILAFVCDEEKFLLLRNNSQDPSHGGDFWFTVTGSLDVGENEEETVKREVLEETGLIVKDIFDLNWGSIYNWNDKNHQEKNFIAFVKKEKVKLSEEHTNFEWLNLEDFIKRIKWYLDKEELSQVLKKALKREVFFKKRKVNDLRRLI